MRYIFLAFLLSGFVELFGQTGNYFLSHYSQSEDRFDNVCFDMVQDARGLTYFATRNGVLEFDGRNWELIPGPGAVYSLQLTAEGDLYWSGAAGYGKVDIKTPGHRKTETFSKEGVSDILQSISLGDHIYFASAQTLYIESTHQPTVTIQASTLTGSFLGIFELFGSVYVHTEYEGIFKTEGDKLVRSDLRLPDDEVIFCTGRNDHYLIGLANGKVFICGKDLHPKEITLENQAYVDASVVVDGRWVNRDLFVLGTLRGGLIFVQAATGKTQEIVNYNTGLPDNEVYALMSDKNQCVWAAHEYGFTRVAPYLPFRSFSHYSGLSGNLLCAHSFRGNVYVGTSLGLFRLEKEDLYDEITYFEDVEIKEPARSGRLSRKQKAAPVQPATEDNVKPLPPGQESKKKGFLWFLKRNRNKSQTEENTIAPPAPADTEASPSTETAAAKPRYRKVRKTERVLRTSQYQFKKVQGIDAKVTQLLELGGKLIAGGLGGAFEVNDLQAHSLLEEPVRKAYASHQNNILLLATYANEVRAFQPLEKGWQSLDLLDNLNDRIVAMTDGTGQELWLCALDKAYRLDITADTVQHIQTFPIDNPSFDEVACVHWEDQIVLTHGQGFFSFDRSRNSFQAIDSLPKPSLYFSDGEDILYNDTHTWNILGDPQGRSNLQLLNLLRDLRFVTIDRDTEDLWVITSNNELYKFFGEKFTPYNAGYSPLVISVRNGEGPKNPDNLELVEDKSSLSFKVVQPDYLAPQSIEYRYQLKGLDKTWSDWSVINSNIDFPYLPSGDYVLTVQSRDIFGNVKELPAVVFEVLPPYWKRPWFYALEFFVFAGFVLLSFRLSSRYRIISRLLSLLTIIMLIQFIQTVISEIFQTKASPVTDFFVQVMVAFMILPVEGYLRNLMLRSLDSKSGLYRFLTPKSGETISEEKQEQ